MSPSWLNWCFKKSIWVYHANAGSCNGCDIEVVALSEPFASQRVPPYGAKAEETFGSGPYMNIAFSPDGDMAFIVNRAPDSLVIVDTSLDENDSPRNEVVAVLEMDDSQSQDQLLRGSGGRAPVLRVHELHEGPGLEFLQTIARNERY